MLSRPRYVLGDDAANIKIVRKLVEVDRAKAREAYSAGRVDLAAEIYRRIAREYRTAGLEDAAVNFERRALEVLEREREGSR